MKINTQAAAESETIEEITKPGTVFQSGDDFYIADDDDRYINLETGIVTGFSKMDVITILPEATLTPYGRSIKEPKDRDRDRDAPQVKIYTKTLNDTIDLLEGLRSQINNPKKKYSPQAMRARLLTMDNLIERLNMALEREV